MAHRRTSGPVRRVNDGSFGPGADAAKYMADLREQPVVDPNAASNNLAAAMRVREQRVNAQLANPHMPFVSAGNDMAWDSFFGSLQNKADDAADHGVRFRADLAGRGPGTGIGDLGVQMPSGHVEHPLDSYSTQSPSLIGLQRAASRFNR